MNRRIAGIDAALALACCVGIVVLMTSDAVNDVDLLGRMVEAAWLAALAVASLLAALWAWRCWPFWRAVQGLVALGAVGPVVALAVLAAGFRAGRH